MKNQIIPINRSAVIDDALIRLVNENHDRSIREQKERRDRELWEQQMKVARRWKVIHRFMNNLFYTLLGVALTLSMLAFLL